MSLCIALADVQAAQTRLASHLGATPCSYSRTLSALTGAHIYLKFENLQFTASFKERGALNRLLQLTEAQRARGVCAVSDGNHGLAIAYHAERLGVPATIVMARHTPFVKVEHTRGHGAEIILEGDTLAAAHAHARELAAARDLTFVHPYDDPAVMAGHGTIALEMLSAVPDLQTLMVQIGGGGLMAGVAVAARALSSSVEIVGVQTTSHPSMSAAIRGESVAYHGNTIAENIAVKEPGQLTREVARALLADIVLVDEPDLERAIALLLTVEKTVVEGAGAAGLAAVLAQPQRYRDRKIGLILSGGNIDPRLFASVIMRELVREQRIVTVRISIPDQPGVLGRVTQAVGEAGANVLDVFHRRLSISAPAKSTTLELTFEARDPGHSQRIIGAIQAAGFPVTVVPS